MSRHNKKSVPPIVGRSATKAAFLGLATIAFAGCGGGSSDHSGGNSPLPPPPATFSVGGSISGLAGSGLTVHLNGTDPLTLESNGNFTFPTSVASGSAYAVTVARQPLMPRQICTVTHGTGSVSSSDVTSVVVDCALHPGNLRTSIPMPTYQEGSGDLQTFTSINNARSSGQFGQLAQDVNLDAAARAHAQYLAAHFYSAGRFDPAPLSSNTDSGVIGAHAEQQGNSLFTGTRPPDRARGAGYGWIDGAEAAVFNVGTASRDCSDQILDSLILRHKIMNTEMRDIGVGISDTADGKGFVCVVLAAYQDFRGEAPGGWVGVYPFDSAGQISLAMSSDATGETFGTNRGMPIMFMADRDAPLSLTVTLHKTATNELVGTATVTDGTLLGELTSNQVFAVPSEYLEPNTSYTVRAIGTVEGLPVDQSTQFTTGTRSSSAPFVAILATSTVRAIYAHPTDREMRVEYRDAVQMVVEHLQGWYQQQLGGETFSIYSTRPQVCALPNASAYYLDETWSKVQADIQSCAPAGFGDPDYDWIIYADVVHGCNLPGRLGAGANTLTMLPRADLEGLVGRDTGIDDCGNQFPVFPTSRFIGGLGHELGHTLDLPHPSGCDDGQPECDAGSLMWQGVYSYPTSYFSVAERASLLSHRFINVQRFGR